jgi:hypothetical protein
MTLCTRRLLPLAAPALALALAAAGCETAPPGGGFVNPNAGSAVDPDKAAGRTDLPVPDANPRGDEPIAEAAATSPATAPAQTPPTAEKSGTPRNVK